MSVNTAKVFKTCTIASIIALSLHLLVLWAAPFTSIYPIFPSVSILVLFLVVFLIFGRLAINWPSVKISARLDTTDQLDLERLSKGHRLRRLLIIITLTGIAFHIWAKQYLTEIRPIQCLSDIRFAWLEVDRRSLPFYIRWGSVLGHLLTSFAYLGTLLTSFRIIRSKSLRHVAANDIATMFYFCFVGLLYAGYIGSRNVVLAFLIMSIAGVILGLGSLTTSERWLIKLRLTVFILSIPIIFMLVFSNVIFSDRIFCNRSLAAVGRDPSDRQIVTNQLNGSFAEFDLKSRDRGKSLEWRERLFIENCKTCGPAMIYVNHGIYNLSRVFAGHDRGAPVLLRFISAWSGRLGVHFPLSDNPRRVFGPGGLTLAGSAYHDYGILGVVFSAAFLGLLFGYSIRLMQFTGVLMLVGVWLFCCLFYVLLVSNMFVGFGLLPFPFILFGVGAGFATCVLLTNKRFLNR